ncbi:MAG: hypothetical protein EA400_00370 [Chromatiaceae bacterium]|nr:MAG: hypothetical protein EA400_00370 [Chromatiaceae bacterium]
MQAAFVACLAAGVGHPRLCLVLTLRSDVLAQALDLPAYVGLHNRANLTLLPPDRSARLAMIRSPAQRARFALEDGLAEQIATDTGEEPGALPLMAYTLERLYRVRDGGSTWMTRSDHRPVRRAELCAGDRLAAVLADRLIEARLLVPDGETSSTPGRPGGSGADPGPDPGRDPGADQGIVDLAHEALLQHWRQLRDWISGRKEQLRLRGELERAVRDWCRGGYRTADLRPGRAADMAQALAALGLTPSEEQRAFLDPSARAHWLLAQDLSAWQAAGEHEDKLWDADRFENFVGLETSPMAGAAGPGAPLLPAAEDARRGFLVRSFTCVLRHHPEDPRRRARCRDALAALGDPRFDPARWWLPADATCGFRVVPAGAFPMGSPAGEGGAGEQPRHEVRLPTFWIGRWPVTVAQFRAFIDERGVPPEYPAMLERPANQPVALISWDEACAYAAWLGERLGERAPAWASVGGRAAASDGEAARLWQPVAAGKVRSACPRRPNGRRPRAAARASAILGEAMRSPRRGPTTGPPGWAAPARWAASRPGPAPMLARTRPATSANGPAASGGRSGIGSIRPLAIPTIPATVARPQTPSRRSPGCCAAARSRAMGTTAGPRCVTASTRSTAMTTTVCVLPGPHSPEAAAVVPCARSGSGMARWVRLPGRGEWRGSFLAAAGVDRPGHQAAGAPPRPGRRAGAGHGPCCT